MIEKEITHIPIPWKVIRGIDAAKPFVIVDATGEWVQLTEKNILDKIVFSMNQIEYVIEALQRRIDECCDMDLEKEYCSKCRRDIMLIKQASEWV